MGASISEQQVLVCPYCSAKDAKLLDITGTALVCRECGEEMFSYRHDDQRLTKTQLYQRLERDQRNLNTIVRAWLPPKYKPASGILLGYLFTEIAKTLPE